MEPLPASIGGAPVASRMPVAPRCQGWERRDGGRLEIVRPVGRRPAERVPRPVDGRSADRQRWHDQREVERFERQRLDQLADAAHPGPAADEAEGDVGAERRGARDVVVTRPAQHRGRVGRTAAEAAAVRQHLWRCTAAVRPTWRSAAATRFESSSGTPAAHGPSTVRPRRRRIDRQRVVPRRA